jgi:hypothetical protein
MIGRRSLHGRKEFSDCFLLPWAKRVACGSGTSPGEEGATPRVQTPRSEEVIENVGSSMEIQDNLTGCHTYPYLPLLTIKKRTI